MMVEALVYFFVPALVGVLIGVASGLLGIGGGTVMVPIFRLAFGMSATMSTATSLFAIIPTSISGALFTGLGLYDKLAEKAGAGTLVPITGFSNSVAAPALEFKTEGLVTGTAAKMFIIAGPVIVYGISASVIYGLILCLIG